MRGALRLGRVAGIEVGIHYTWLLAFALIAWSLARGIFLQYYSGWDLTTYWIAGILAALLLYITRANTGCTVCKTILSEWFLTNATHT